MADEKHIASELTQLPSGTPVVVTMDDDSKWHTRTRSEPWQLGHGSWVVALEGEYRSPHGGFDYQAGGYDLGRVRKAERGNEAAR